MEIVLGWLAFSGLAAWIASSKGRSGAGIFFLSLLLSPLIGIIAALVMKSKRELARESAEEIPSERTHTRCPECKELVRKDALKCKHCAAQLAPQPIPLERTALMVRCPKCHAKNMDYAKKCSYCRTELVAG